MSSVGSSQPNASTGGKWKRQLEELDRRFYRNLNEIRIEHGMPPVNSLFDPIGNAINDRTIFLKIWNDIYPISREILHTVFSEFGILVGIERLSRGFHSTIRFFDKDSTIRAFEYLNGRYIYDDCCKLELFLVTAMEASCSNQESVAFEESTNLEEIEEIEVAYPSQELINKPKVCNDVLELEQARQRTLTIHQEISTEVSQAINTNDLSSEIVGASDMTKFSKVTSDSLNSGKIEDASLESVGIDDTNCAIHDNLNGMRMALTDFRMVAIECLRISIAHKVFVEMSGPVETSFANSASRVKRRVQDGNPIFDPRITHFCIGLDNFMKTNVHTVCKNGRKRAMLDIGEADCRSLRNDESDGFLLEFESPRAAHESRVVIDACDVFGDLQPAAVIKGDMIVFDPRGIHWLLKIGLVIMVPIFQEMEVQLILVENFVFDPGISNGAMSSLKIIKDQLVLMSSDRGQAAATVIDLSKSLILVFNPGGGCYGLTFTPIRASCNCDGGLFCYGLLSAPNKLAGEGL